ncbi:MAG: aminomethyl-transferring glycine dehydrogenase [Sulfobacillus acidophilus]|uniref:Aminomethyl-transferring glycine dehydrogenase n=1 Tax=Sulfobacillus acidophilus TaxID=53633 RepID=A0A2T2WPN1_9FIRM|nr:MAG: aminomethyl-transferring glycine dehydrogenase [Sulfobacillus acidophilus]
MLESLSLASIDALFEDIPAAARLNRPLNLPPPLSEMDLAQHLRRLAERNIDVNQMPSFLGGGYYDRYIPAAVGALASRGEFVTSYTPYQAELSQGTLAAIFEFQSMIQSLTGTYAAQASMYDGASAVGEASLLALAHARGRRRIVALRGVHPDSREVMATYLQARGAELVVVDSISDLPAAMDADVAGVVTQYPNMLGSLTDAAGAVQMAHDVGALAIVAVDPVAMAVLKPPGEMGADVVVGEGQPLGNHLSYGGPTFGFFAVQEPLVRKLPGRLVGAARDANGARGFVLTLQAREQHIRREKATSNICSNHSLNALAATIYMALLGPQGLKEVALASAQMAHYLERQLAAIGVRRPDAAAPFLYEFAVEVAGDITALNRHLWERGLLGGMNLGLWEDQWQGLWQLAVTERRSKADCDRLVEEVAKWMSR